MIHELALAATYFGVTVDNLASITPDREYSSFQTIGNYSDFATVGFELTTKSGSRVGVKGDRCGGNDSFAVVEKDGKELFRSVVPDAQLAAQVKNVVSENPDIMPYFPLQAEDYLTLKNKVIENILSGTPATGVATIEIGIEALKLGEFITAKLIEDLLIEQPNKDERVVFAALKCNLITVANTC